VLVIRYSFEDQAGDIESCICSCAYLNSWRGIVFLRGK